MKRNPPVDIQELLQSGFRFSLSLTHDESAAEDLLQEACEKILKVKGPWHRGYLFATIRNRFIDLYRKKKKFPLESFDEVAGKKNTPHQLVNPDNNWRSIESDSLEQVLAKLSPTEREVLYLTAVEGYTAREISKITGSPRNTVLSRIHRSRHKLRALLEHESSKEFS